MSSVHASAHRPLAQTGRTDPRHAGTNGRPEGVIAEVEPTESHATRTEVSSSPRDGSAIDRLVDLVVDVAKEQIGIDVRCSFDAVSYRRARYKTARRHRAEFGHRHSASGNDDRLTALNLPQHRRRVVTKFPLGDGTSHA